MLVMPTTSPAHVEERAAAVARIDLGGGLQIKLASKLTCLGAEDAFGDGALKAKRAADGKDALADGQGIGIAQQDEFEFGRVLVIDLEQGEILKFVHGHDAHLFVADAVQHAVLLMIDLDGNLSLTFDDVEIGHEKAVLVDDEAGAEPAGSADLDHRFADLIDKVPH